MSRDGELAPVADVASVTTPVGERPDGIRMIVHQLNNALLPILTLGSLLADSQEEPTVKHDIDAMVASAMKARELVKLLLAETDRLDNLRSSDLPLPFGNRAPS